MFGIWQVPLPGLFSFLTPSPRPCIFSPFSLVVYGGSLKKTGGHNRRLFSCRPLSVQRCTPRWQTHKREKHKGRCMWGVEQTISECKRRAITEGAYLCCLGCRQQLQSRTLDKRNTLSSTDKMNELSG